MQWLGFEIHPETPEPGISLSSIIPRAYADSMAQRLREMGAPFGITFTDIDVLPNSRLSLEAAEFARANGKYESFHEAAFRAYFTQGKDIGSIDVLEDIGRGVGLDAVAMGEALRSGEYRAVLTDVREQAVRRNVTAIPRFIIEDRDDVVGAQSIEVFRDILRSY